MTRRATFTEAELARAIRAAAKERRENGVKRRDGT